jgi:TonB family protein
LIGRRFTTFFIAAFAFLASIADANATDLVLINGPLHPCQFPKFKPGQPITGDVQLSFRIRRNGTTSHVVVTRSSGRTEFDMAAIECVRKSRYRPNTLNFGKSTELPWKISIAFRPNH